MHLESFCNIFDVFCPLGRHRDWGPSHSYHRGDRNALIKQVLTLETELRRVTLGVQYERGQGTNHFLCSADHEQDWQPYPVDPSLAICDDHTYIHTLDMSLKEKLC